MLSFSNCTNNFVSPSFVILFVETHKKMCSENCLLQTLLHKFYPVKNRHVKAIIFELLMKLQRNRGGTNNFIVNCILVKSHHNPRINLYLGLLIRMQGGRQHERLIHSILSSNPYLRPVRLRSLLPTPVWNGNKVSIAGKGPDIFRWFTLVPSQI